MSLQGKTIAFTGELLGMSRKEAAMAAQAAGAFVSNSVSGNVDYLVAGVNAGANKTGKAQSMGVNVLSQPQFAQMTGGAAPKKAAAPAHVSRKAAPAGASAVQYPAEFLAMNAGTVRKQAVHVPVPAATGAVQYPAEYLAMNNSGVVPKARKQAFQTPAAQPTQMPQLSKKAVQIKDHTVCFTGTLENASRAEAVVMARNAGATVNTIPTATTNYMVCGLEPTQSKINKAQALGIALISEQQFIHAARVPVAATAVPTPASSGAVQYPAEFLAMNAAAPVHARKAPKQAMVPQEAMKTVPEPEISTGGAMPWETEAEPAAPDATGIQLAGKHIVFTGALGVNRMAAAVMANKAGAIVGTALNAHTNFLICGENAGSKVKQAHALGVPVITEAQFLAACPQ